MTHDRDAKTRQRVEQDSDALLAAIEDIRRLELEKRKVPMSTPDFHDRADEIEERSRDVFAAATLEEIDGNALPHPQAESINDESNRLDDGTLHGG